jgi:hypothetical protein
MKRWLGTELKPGSQFNVVKDDPRDAWLEGIVNALCHRFYNPPKPRCILVRDNERGIKKKSACCIGKTNAK